MTSQGARSKVLFKGGLYQFGVRTVVQSVTGLRSGGKRLAKAESGSFPAAVIFAASLILLPWPAAGQTPPAPTAGEASGQTRIARLQDSLEVSDEWVIGVPVIESDSSFDALIDAGRALDSAAYLALDRELRQVRALLAAQPEDATARRRLAEVRGALAERIELNIALDYLYAATVYIELFRQAEGSPSDLSRFSRRLSERRSLLADALTDSG